MRLTALLVIGYGNALRTDDGVGWHAARLLAGDPRLADVVVVAEHQLAPELAFDLSLASLVVLLDASTETPAGTVRDRSADHARCTTTAAPTLARGVTRMSSARKITP